MMYLSDEDYKEVTRQLDVALEFLRSYQISEKKLKAQIAHQQFLIDSLMIEYCPDEMTEEQWENWKAHQRKAEL